MPKRDKNLLEAGIVVAAHGVRGEVKLNCCTDTPEFLQGTKTFYFEDGTPLEVSSTRVHKGCLLVRLHGVDNMDDAMRLLNRKLYFDKTKKRLPEGRYYIDDLIGLHVRDSETGEEYGLLEDVSQTGANDVYSVRTSDGKLLWFPAIREVVVRCSPETGELLVKPLPGLLEL